MDEIESLIPTSSQKPIKHGFFKRIQIFFNRIRIFFIYRSILKEHRDSLNKGFNIRIDDVYRMYTVYVVPDDIISLLALKDNKYHMVFQQEVTDRLTSYIKALSNYLRSIGLSEEWFGITEMTRLDDQNYKIVISFAAFNTVKVANYLIGIAMTIGAVGLIWLVKAIMNLF